jgi:general secretion pathway protein H
MPTSATGAERGGEAGFTLVEVLVALVVMALLTGAVLMTLPGEGPRLAAEAERLAARLDHARDEALTGARPVEVALTDAGYALRAQRKGRWEPLDDGVLEPVAWPEGLTASVESADGRSAVRFDPTGAAEAAVITLSSGERRTRVTVDPQGEVRIDDGPR